MMNFEVIEIKNGVSVHPVPHFHPRHTFLCGQCFRWNEEEDGSFTGIAFGKVVNVSLSSERLIIKNSNSEDFHAVWRRYFDLDRNYAEIKAELSRDKIMAEAIGHGWGIRILRQDLWETLASFIISANNNIPRIKGIIERLCMLCGESIMYNGREFFTFPDAEAVSTLTEKELESLRAGYRAKYISAAARMYARGEIDAETLKNAPLNEARRHLLSVPGVGPKVADCVLLFGAGRFGVFPADVWIRRVMSELYGCGEERAAQTGEQRFGDLSGFAQQYLYYWRRGD